MPTRNDPFNRAQQRKDQHRAEVNRTQTECTRLYDNLGDVEKRYGHKSRMYMDANRQYLAAEKANHTARKLVDADNVVTGKQAVLDTLTAKAAPAKREPGRDTYAIRGA